MDRGLVSPDWAPLVKLLESVLAQVRADLAGFAPVHLAISSGIGEDLVRLASLGSGVELVDAQVDQLGGPLPDAVATGLPIAVADVWSDPRWLRLTRNAMTALH